MSAAEKNRWEVGGSHKGRIPSRHSMWIRWMGAAVLVLMAIHSLSYGTGFVVNPVDGAREFGDNTPPSEAAEHLAGLIGVILLLLALAAAVAAVMLLRGRPGGAWLTLSLGIAMLSIAAYWAFLGSKWDASIYGAFGFLLTGTGAMSVWYAMQDIEA